MTSDFATQLAGLRSSFTANLPSKLADVVAAIEDARRSPELLPLARMRVHRLSGSAGSYGHPELGDTLAAVEVVLESAEPFGPLLYQLLSTAHAWTR